MISTNISPYVCPYCVNKLLRCSSPITHVSDFELVIYVCPQHKLIKSVDMEKVVLFHFNNIITNEDYLNAVNWWNIDITLNCAEKIKC